MKNAFKQARAVPARKSAKSAKRAQGGFSIIAAIFLIVVLAGLGVAMVSISTVQHSSSSLDVLGVRALQAARAGVEWGVFQRLRGANRTSYCANAGAPVATTTFAMPGGNSLSPFTVTVVCSLNVIATTDVLAVAGVVTVTTAIDHHLIVGDQISIGGVSPAQFNGTAIVVSAVTATNAFSYVLAGAAGGASAQGVFSRGAALDRWQIKATACNQPHVSTGCPNPSPSRDYVQRVIQAEL